MNDKLLKDCLKLLKVKGVDYAIKALNEGTNVAIRTTYNNIRQTDIIKRLPSSLATHSDSPVIPDAEVLFWTPAELGDQLVVWYDGTVTVDGNNHVVTAVDKSGNNNHGIVFGPGTLTTGSFNGLGSIIRASGDAGIEVPIGREDAYAFYMTVDRMASTNGVLVNFGTTTQYFGAYDSSPTQTVINSGVVSDGVRMNGGDFAGVRIELQSTITDGGVVGCEFTAVNAPGFTEWKIAQYPTTSYWFGGQWGDFIMLKSHPTTKNRQRIEGYLAHRRGIQNKLPIDHPHRENPPVNDLTEGS